MTTIDTFLASLERDFGSQGKGKPFEVFCKWFLENDPVWSKIITQVWLWKEYPQKWQRKDLGTDLVFEDINGCTWAVQAKCFGEEERTKKDHVNSFLADSGRPQVDKRLWIQTTNKMDADARTTLHGQDKPVTVISLDDLRDANLAYPKSFSALTKVKSQKQPTALPHQRAAIKKVLRHFKNQDRGRLIMACGTGKTLTTLWIKEGLAAKRTLVLVPSLNLVSQSMREWSFAASTPFKPLAVCSDKSVGRGTEDIASQELPFPVTSEIENIVSFIKEETPCVIFCTYHSSELIAEAQKFPKTPAFDLVVADEAHRCAGKASADFSIILDGEKIRASKRLFTTATPKYFANNVRRAAQSRDIELVGMNDEEAFGPEFHRLTFGEAIEKQLLNDYQVVVLGVDRAGIKEIIDENWLIIIKDKIISDAATVAAQLGVLKAIRRFNLKRVISFHSLKSRAKNFSDELDTLLATLKPSQRPEGRFYADFVTGDMKTSDRRQKIRNLEKLEDYDRGILTNARCLGEGVNVPVLDGIAFIDPKDSQIDIIQSVGRAIRRVRGVDDQKLGTIVIPVFIEDCDTAEQAIALSKFEPVWSVLKALRAHDEVLAELLDSYRLSLAKRTSSQRDFGGKLIFDIPTNLPEGFASALKTKIIEKTTETWEYWFGILENFIEEHGHARVEAKYITNDKKQLGVWCDTQRLHFRNGLLRGDRVGRLENLKTKGWVWSLKDTQRSENFRRLKAFYLREGHSLVPDGHKEYDGFALGNASRGIKHAYSNGTLEPEWISQLENELDFIWDKDRFFWIQDYKNLRKWCRENKKSNPPKNKMYQARISSTKSISRNLEAFRNRCVTSYRYWEAGEKGNRKTPPRRLSQKEIAALEHIPFWAWDSREASYHQTLAMLDDFLQGKSVTDIVVTTDHLGFPLGARLQKIRNRRNTVPNFVLKHLQSVGYELDPFESKWKHMFNLLETYAQENETAYVSQSTKFRGKTLGSWVSTQRQNYKLGKLGEEKILALEGLKGWVWDASDLSASGRSKRRP